MIDVTCGVWELSFTSCCQASPHLTVTTMKKSLNRLRLGIFHSLEVFGRWSVKMPRTWYQRCSLINIRKGFQLERPWTTNGSRTPQRPSLTPRWWQKRCRTCRSSALLRNYNKQQWAWWFKIWSQKKRLRSYKKYSNNWMLTKMESYNMKNCL